MAAAVPIVTNIGTAVQPRANDAGGISVATVEASGPIPYKIEQSGERCVTLLLEGVRTRMPEDTIKVYDGLLSIIEMTSRVDELRLVLSLEHPATLAVRRIPGLPARLRLELSRAPLYHILRGRRVVIDPGHGGDDIGGRGPIDLVEKRMTLTAARYLAEQLTDLGCLVTLTRQDDTFLSWEERFAIAAHEHGEVMVSLHTGWFSDPARNGVKTCWLNPMGKPLAERIQATLLRKLPLPDRGVGEGGPVVEIAMPAVIVEFATISNPVEEGWLRSSTFLKRAAGAVVNGIKEYFGEDKKRSELKAYASLH